MRDTDTHTLTETHVCTHRRCCPLPVECWPGLDDFRATSTNVGAISADVGPTFGRTRSDLVRGWQTLARERPGTGRVRFPWGRSISGDVEHGHLGRRNDRDFGDVTTQPTKGSWGGRGTVLPDRRSANVAHTIEEVLSKLFGQADLDGDGSLDMREAEEFVAPLVEARRGGGER